MQITKSIKRAPRWAWFTAAGVGLGAAAIKLYRGRDVEDPAREITDGTGAGTTGGVPVLTASPTSVITPTVVGVPNSNDDGGILLGMMQLWSGAVTTTIDQLQEVYGPIAQAQLSLLEGLPDAYQHNQWTPDQILALMQGGASPAVATQAPPQASVPVPVAQPPVQSAPAPPPPAPAPQPVPTATSSGPQCGGEFPFASSRGCYKVACASGKGERAKGRWHLYAPGSGPDQRVSSDC